MGVGFCIGVMAGVQGSLTLGCMAMRMGQSVPKALAADVNYVGREALTQAFVNYAREHPEEWSDGFSATLILALAGKWPCETDK